MFAKMVEQTLVACLCLPISYSSKIDFNTDWCFNMYYKWFVYCLKYKCIGIQIEIQFYNYFGPEPEQSRQLVQALIETS